MNEQLTKPVRAVLLAAGLGRRMKSSLPKVLHQILGKTILSYILDAMVPVGVEHVYIVVGHGAKQVQDFIESNPPQCSWSCHRQEVQLGTGHALAQVRQELEGFTGTLLVSVADVPMITSVTLEKLIRQHQNDEAVVSLLTTCVDDPKNYGRIVRNKEKTIIKIVEDKDATADEKAIKEINPAIYCFAWPQIKEGLLGLTNKNKQGEYYLTDLVEWASGRGLKLSGVLTACWQEVSGINSQAELAEASCLMRDQAVAWLMAEHGVTVVDPKNTWIAPCVSIGQDTVILPGCYLTGDIQIGSNCVIGPHTQISGPAKIGSGSSVVQSVVSGSSIGNNVKVGPFAHLREGACVLDRCRIGNFVEVKLSEIGSCTNVSHLSYIGDALLGQEVNIGAGTITANYDRLSGKKSQTVLKDKSSTGSNSVLVAPVVVGTDAMVAAGTVVTHDVPDGALAVGRSRQENKTAWTEARRQKSL